MVLVLCACCSSCIEPYEPVLEESQEVMVISGMITDQPGRQILTISRSAPYRNPGFHPVENCVVALTDQEGNMLHYTDEGQGIYSVDVPETSLETGDAVSIHVITPDMREYRSSYDTILPCPELDSIYYEIQTKETSNPEKILRGIQFYADMSGALSDSRNIIWRIQETWEYWAALFGTHIWRGFGLPSEEYRSNPIFKCWKSYPLNQFYTGTTRNLSSNELHRVALNYVSDRSDRLSVTYSLLVQQQSLSRAAFDYWQRIQEQLAESGGLWETQPSTVPGNLYSVFDPEEVVLGFFYASQVKAKRVFVHNNNYFEFYIPHIECEYQPLSVIWQWETIDFPVYIYSPGPFKPSWTGPSFCFDCRIQGGETIKPEYWESWH